MLTYLFLCLFITNVYAETVETPYLVADMEFLLFQHKH